MFRARVSVDGGVGGLSNILKSGWKAVKCSGTSGPSSRKTHFVSASISVSESFSPGISSVVISNHTSVSCFRYTSVSSTGCRCPKQIFR